MIDTTNDRVQVYAAADGFRWRRFDPRNGRKLSESSESYVAGDYCTQAARAYNADVTPDRFDLP